MTKLDSIPLGPKLFRPGSETYPVFEVSTAILQQIFKLDCAVGHEVIIANRGVMENWELNLLSIVYLCDKLIIPCWAVGLLPGGSLAHTWIIHIEGNVCVQQEGLGLGAHCMAQWPRCGLQVQSFADFYLQQAVEHNHDDARTGNCLPLQCQTLIQRKCFACSYHHVISKDQF